MCRAVFSIQLYFLTVFLLHAVFVKCNSVITSNYNEADLLNAVDKNDNDKDPGKPLYLTKYIEEGKFEEGRKAAVVKSFAGNVKSYAGYLTVNKEYNSNLFFWYFQSEKNYKQDPTVIWLQGGPGSSSLFGLFNENGPYIITKNKILKRKYTWSKISNLIYFDNPVGTGYSFTENDLGYATNQTQVGKNLYDALIQILKLFPNLQKNDLFITGESYAGKYVPAFGHTIYWKNKNKPEIEVNLKGLMIGNAWTDPIHMMKYGDYLYELGLIDDTAKKEFHKIESLAIKKIKQKKWRDASKLFDKLVGDETSLYYKYTGLPSYYNYYNVRSGDWEDYEEKFITGNLFRRNVHVGNRTYNNGYDVYEKLYEDVPKSVINWVVELLNNYRVLFYNGQLDVICAYPLTVNYLRNMKWKLSHEYKRAKRYIYKTNNEILGYFKSVGNLTEVLVRNSGHMVPTDEPTWGLQLLDDFINNNITLSRFENNYDIELPLKNLTKKLKKIPPL